MKNIEKNRIDESENIIWKWGNCGYEGKSKNFMKVPLNCPKCKIKFKYL